MLYSNYMVIEYCPSLSPLLITVVAPPVSFVFICIKINADMTQRFLDVCLAGLEHHPQSEFQCLSGTPTSDRCHDAVRLDAIVGPFYFSCLLAILCDYDPRVRQAWFPENELGACTPFGVRRCTLSVSASLAYQTLVASWVCRCVAK